MAKKVRRPPEEEGAAFEFPSFDEGKYFAKELELGGAVALVVLLAALAGALSWGATALAVPWFVPFAVGFAFVIGSYWIVARLRPKSEVYTRGDWAGLIATEFFGWLAVWFVLVNLL